MHDNNDPCSCGKRHGTDLVRSETRCDRCHNWLSICGHNLPFAERMKSIGIDRTSLTVK